MKINRLYFNKLYQEITEPEISILFGARQVGKSTLMHQLEKKAQSEGYKTAFYDLEQSADLHELSGEPGEVIEKLTTAAKIIFIDEFHYLKNASKIFKAIYDGDKGVKIFASGSSSLEIHKHLKESLAGRFRKTMIFPLSLQEWKQVAGFEAPDYLQWGGMPGLLHCSPLAKRVELLENIVSTYITKDIKGLIKEENVRAFNSLIYLLAQAQGSMGVFSNLARETGLSESTVSRHLEIMAQTYVLHVLPSFSQNMANELKKSKKYYFFDMGIRNSLLKDFRPAQEREDQGTLFESAVLLQLIVQLKANMELRFWRTKKGEEVDFILLKNRVPIPMEVKSKVDPSCVPSGMVQFFKKYQKAPFGIVFNTEVETQAKVENRVVYFKCWPQSAKLDFLEKVI